MYEKSDKEKRIKKELKKLKQIFQNMAENKKSVINPLLENAAFMSVSLVELQNIVNEKGYTEEYQNGANQSGVKQVEEVKIHLAMQKNYTQIIEKLLPLLPVEERKNSKLQAFKNAK